MMKNRILNPLFPILATSLAWGQAGTLPTDQKADASKSSSVSATAAPAPAAAPVAPAPGNAAPSAPAATPSTATTTSDDAGKTEVPSSAPTKPAPSLKNYQYQDQYLTFTPDKNGLKILPPQLNYSIDQSDDVILSDIVFNEDTFRANLGPLHVLTDSKKVPLEPKATVLFFTAPLALAQKGQIEILSETGKILASKVIQNEHIENGKLLAESLKANFWKSAKPENQTNILMPADELKEPLIDTDRKSGFRFCWNRSEENYFSRFCTPYYRYSKKDQRIKIQPQTSTTKVFVDSKEAKPEDSIEVTPNKTKRFLATSTKGFSFEFNSLVEALYLKDYYLDESKQWVYLVGHTTVPTYPETKFFPAIDPDGLITFFHWKPTIALPKDHWVSVVPRNNPRIVLPGKGGGLFTYPLEISKAPSIKARVALKRPLKSTYSRWSVLRASIAKGLQVAPIPPGKTKISKSGDDLTWNFNAAQTGAEQVGGLIVKEDGQEFQTFHTLYRGYSAEFSMRLAGVVSADLQLNLLGEVAYNQWFESLLGWENQLLSVQRWGVSARHFAPLKTFTPKGSTAAPLTLKLTTLDLKYRLTPGLWERDETWGLILGAEDIVINNIHGTFGGLGFFWARSMPEIFDIIMNWFPFMSYPKWVDMEMIYYLAPMTATVVPGQSPTYAINFHGKILWTKYFFGEAGFGFKAYDYKTVENTVKLQALYGTAGLGINF